MTFCGTEDTAESTMLEAIDRSQKYKRKRTDSGFLAYFAEVLLSMKFEGIEEAVTTLVSISQFTIFVSEGLRLYVKDTSDCEGLCQQVLDLSIVKSDLKKYLLR